MLGRILALKRPPFALAEVLLLLHLKQLHKAAWEDVVIPDLGTLTLSHRSPSRVLTKLPGSIV